MYKPSDRTLVNYIPVGAPATRRPSREMEKNVRVSVGFLPEWYISRAGVRFGKEWHENCEYRYDALLAMKKAAHERFPMIEEFRPRIGAKGYDEDCATISGVYGSKLIAMLYGFPVRFPEDDWPTDISNASLPYDALARLKPIDLDDNPVMERLDKQMDGMERVFGRINGFLNYQGVLNTAMKLRGNDILTDMIEDEGFAIALFENIADVTARLVKRVQARQRASGVEIDLLSLSNCTVNMISPAMYERFILPHDAALSKQFARFGIHTCNWNVTPYLPALRKIDNIGYLDMGSMSDMRKARQMFPETRLAVLYSPISIEQKPLVEIKSDLRDIIAKSAPCDIVLADLTASTDEEKLRDLLSYINALEADFNNFDSGTEAESPTQINFRSI